MSRNKGLRHSGMNALGLGVLANYVAAGCADGEACPAISLENTKQIRQHGQRLANRQNVQTTWGRVRDAAVREYADALQLTGTRPALGGKRESCRLGVVDQGDFALPWGRFTSRQVQEYLCAELRSIAEDYGSKSLEDIVVRVVESPDGSLMLQPVEGWQFYGAGHALGAEVFRSLQAPSKCNHTTTSEWTETLNRRRCELIDKDIQGTISRAEQVELVVLTQRMREHVDSEANLPLDGVRELHRQLLAAPEPEATDAEP